MNNKKRNFLIGAVLAVVASGLLVASLKLPLWKMRMESPQYQGDEAIKVEVYPGEMRGDLKEIKTLNKYMGVELPEKLPQLSWLPKVLIAGAILGFLGSFLPIFARRSSLMTAALIVSCAMFATAGLAQWQMYNIGHHRHRAPIARTQDFTTPIIGSVKIANFHIHSSLGWGAYFIGLAVVLHVTAGRFARSDRSCPVMSLFRKEPKETPLC